METKDNEILLTIAIPFFNAEKFLSKAIESVLNQNFTDWNLILLDDGSSDNSLSIARKYEKVDKRIKVFSDGENKNLGFRLNEIPSLVSTKYLMRMDADDIMHPQKIEKQLEVLFQHPEIDVLGTNAYTINENDEIVGIRINPITEENIISVSSFIHPTIVAKTTWFRNNPYDVKAIRIEDLELWYRTGKNNNFKILTEPLFYYREFGGYYKKYFSAQKAKDYIMSKYPNDPFWKKYFRNNLIKGILYQIFNFFHKESFLINRRNEIVFKEKDSINK
ncbi:glycosyltransferase family 2 protein [Chryseobacterium sp.]|uniref:glycosyltransferase family 2 protein n=1 Tax=Chryseobacterium sp. TaxID=1871047 RepID=UPI0012D0E520|nr:glycosyltransferase family 2 protein [Chryseobacterium sp.]MPS65207.1 glycosyltransferase family 2 protein [Chryseobacterium sp.]